MSHIYKWCLHSLDFTEGALGMALARSRLTSSLIQNPEVVTTRYSNPEHLHVRHRFTVEARSRVGLLNVYI